MKIEKQMTIRYILELSEQEANDLFRIMKLYNKIYDGKVLLDTPINTEVCYSEVVQKKACEIGDITSKLIIENLLEDKT